MRVQIITKDNGWGLSHDIRVLRSALVGVSGHHIEVVTTDWERPGSTKAGSFDVNIFLELLNPAFFPQAKRNVFVPNPEWFFAQRWRSLLPRVTEVWAKTRDCEAIFSKMHHRVHFTGWTSDDLYQPDTPKDGMFLHVAGNSSAKGTMEVLQAFSLRMSYDLLLISRRGWGTLPRNVKQVDHLDRPDFLREFNRHLVHLCPSSYEGFGHYINEARAVASVVVTTNAAPMNELITPETGIGVATAAISHQNLAVHQHVDPFQLAQMLDLLANTPPAVLRSIGERARAAFVRDDRAFQERLIELLRP